MLIRFGRAFAAAWLIGAALAAAPIAAQTGGADPRLAPAPGIKVDEDFLIGVWSDREDCSERIVFLRDGRFVNQDGSEGRWRLDGAVLTLTARNVVSVGVVPQSVDRITVVNEDGSLGWSQRCPTRG